MTKKTIKIGVPKGSLEEHSLKIFRLAGFNITVLPRNYVLQVDDPDIEAFLIRPQEIPRYVEQGKLDIGISGKDWIVESRANVSEVCDLRYAKREIKKVKWVLAVSNDSKIKTVKDLEGKTISTEIVSIVKEYLKKNNVKAKVEFSWGATEVKPPLFADAAVDLTETEESLRAHNLKILDTVFVSSTKLVANKDSLKDPWKQDKIQSISLLLNSAVLSEEMTLVSMHVPRNKITNILKILPKSGDPTIKKITGTNWYDVLFSASEKQIKCLLPKLKSKGCQGIVEFSLNKITQ